jgi:hypothetical protein
VWDDSHSTIIQRRNINERHGSDSSGTVKEKTMKRKLLVLILALPLWISAQDSISDLGERVTDALKQSPAVLVCKNNIYPCVESPGLWVTAEEKRAAMQATIERFEAATGFKVIHAAH